MLKWWRNRNQDRMEALGILRERTDRALKKAGEVDAGLKAHRRDIDAAISKIVGNGTDSQVVSFAPVSDDDVWAAPTRAHTFDAGVDLRISKGVTLAPGASAKVPTATTVRIPKGYFGLLAIRSGLGAKGVTLLNGVGIIDHGYEGEIGLILANFGSDEWSASPGDRVAQLIVIPCVTGLLGAPASAHPRGSESARGDGGFGSTGR